jgi:FkbM family methyltransferase
MVLEKIKKLIHLLQTPIYFEAFLKYGVAAGIEHSKILRHLNSTGFKAIIDIGANRGQFALVARICFPYAKIICFEPLSEPARVLKKVFNRDPLISIHEIAIGEIETQRTMHVSKQDDSSSLLQITSLQTEIFPGTEEKETRLVLVKPLEAVITKSDIEQPALLKIDVQGFENEILKGCQSLLPYFSYIYTECSFIPLYAGQALAHEIISLLDKKGFDLSGIYNLSYDKKGAAIQGDFLFVGRDST